MARVVVFKKNTPWGTVRDSRNNIVYRHIINFVDNNNNFSQNLKDEFINNFLCEAGEDYKKLLDEAQPLPFKYIDELNISFTATVKNQNNRFNSTAELEMSDFAIVKINDETRFYVLSVAERTAKRVVFVGNIDIFFTYNLRFNDERENYIIQSHIDRWNSDLNPTWEQQLIAEDYKVPLLQSESKVVEWNYPFHSSVSQADRKKFESIKWFVVYFKAQTYGSDNINKDVKYGLSNPTGWDLKNMLFNCPYNIAFWPVDFEGADNFLIKKNDSDSGETIHFREILRASLVDNELILSVKLLDVLPFNLFGNYPQAEISRGNNQWIFNFKTQGWLNPFKFYDEFTFLDSFKKSGIKTATADVFVVGEMNEFQFENHFLTSKPITLEKPKKPDSSINIIQPRNLNFETKLYTLPFLVYSLKWWNSEMKMYNLPYLKDGVVKLISALNGENDSMLAFMETTNQDVIINNNNLLISDAVNELPTKTDAYLNYMRKNKEQIAIQKKFGIASMVLGGIFTIAGGIASARTAWGRYKDYGKRKQQWKNEGYDREIIADKTTAGITGPHRKGIWDSVMKPHMDKKPSGFALGANMIGDFSNMVMGAGVGAIVSGARSIVSIDAVQEDLARQSPAVNPGNNIFLNLVMNKTKKNELQYLIQKPNPAHRKLAGDNMGMYGYKVLQLKKLKDVVNSRYLHNYIIAKDVFNSLDNKLSPRIKEIITNAFDEGISIWHYRSKQTWKGILSYRWENWEMTVLKKLNKI